MLLWTLWCACRPEPEPGPEPEPSDVVCELGGAEQLLHTTSGNSATPDAVRLGDTVLVVWEENDGASDGHVVALPLASDGSATTDPVEVAALDGWGAQPQVVATSDEDALLVWLQSSFPLSCGPVMAQRVDAAGQPMGEAEALPGSEFASCVPPAVEWAGDQGLVVWVEEAEEDQSDLFAVPYDLDEGWGTSIRVTEGAVANAPRLAADGDEAVLVYTGLGDGGWGWWWTRLGADGQPGTPMQLMEETSPRYVEPAAIDGALAVVWDTREGRQDAWLQLAFLEDDGLTAPVPFSDGDEGSVNDLSHLATGELLGMAWSDDRGNQAYGTASDAQGRRTCGDLRLSEGTSGFALQPDAVATDDGFLFLWRDTRDRTGGDLYTRTLQCGPR